MTCSRLHAPPGAQILYTNPVFVPGHDFLGTQGIISTWHTTEVFGSGWPSNAGGRLVGSLSRPALRFGGGQSTTLVPAQPRR